MGVSKPQTAVPIRRLRFEWDGVEADGWHHELPEFGAAANALSLLFPHGEAFVISAVRAGLAEIDDPGSELVEAVDSWVGQEGAHFKAHRDFNAALTSQSRMARFLDRVGAAMFRAMNGRSAGFRVAYAAGFEMIAFCSARWAEAGMHKYFGGADPKAASLFLWHLAEEVEHKGIPHDVVNRHPKASRKYPLALIWAFITLIGFTVVGGLAMFMRRPYALNPLRWIRLIGWGFSYAFTVMPIAFTSLGSSFHPEQLVDPPWMRQWLSEYDPATETLPFWTDAGTGDGAMTSVIASLVANESDPEDDPREVPPVREPSIQ